MKSHFTGRRESGVEFDPVFCLQSFQNRHKLGTLSATCKKETVCDLKQYDYGKLSLSDKDGYKKRSEKRIPPKIEYGLGFQI